MKEGIHPNYRAAKVVCACGNSFETRSTIGDIHVEICAACHPFFTGKQKILDTAGRIERFKTRYAASPKPGEAPAKKAAPAAAPAPAKAAKTENRATKRAKANAGRPKPKAEAKPAEPAAPAAEPAPEAKPETPTA